MKYTIMLSCLAVLFTFGCQERLTRDQWLKRLPPPKTYKEAAAMAHLQTELKVTEQKIKNMAIMDKVKIGCVIGAMASIAAIVLGTSGIKTFGIAGLIACMAGMALAYLNTEYPKWLALGGLLIALPAGGYAIFVQVRAMKEVVGNVEEIKSNHPELKSAVRIKTALSKQSDSTRKLVNSVKRR